MHLHLTSIDNLPGRCSSVHTSVVLNTQETCQQTCSSAMLEENLQETITNLLSPPIETYTRTLWLSDIN